MFGERVFFLHAPEALLCWKICSISTSLRTGRTYQTFNADLVVLFFYVSNTQAASMVFHFLLLSQDPAIRAGALNFEKDFLTKRSPRHLFDAFVHVMPLLNFARIGQAALRQVCLSLWCVERAGCFNLDSPIRFLLQLAQPWRHALKA